MTGSGDVVLLGAGFSRAVSTALPLANELGQAAYEHVAKADPGLFADASPASTDYPFEVWLSLLAEDQPHLTEAANRKNAARFTALSDSLLFVLSHRQEQALSMPGPSWLFDWLTVFHQRRSTVATFNYDSLVEAAVNSMHIGPHEPFDLRLLREDGFGLGRGASGPARITADDILRGQPRLPDQQPDVLRDDTFRLIKLHGSLDWWWVPQDAAGATFARQSLRSSFGYPNSPDEKQRRLELPGRERFIVPPLALKSRYYANPVTRQLWQDAYEGLREANTISVVGYSLPQTDIVTGGLLSAALRDSGADICVVNPNAREVAHALAILGGPHADSGRVQLFDGENCIDAFVRRQVSAQAQTAAQEISLLEPLHRPADPDPAMVSWSQDGRATTYTVTAMDHGQDGCLVLRIKEGVGPSGYMEGQPTTSDVVTATRAGATRLKVSPPDGPEAFVVGFRAPNFDNPHTRQILYLIPAGQVARAEASA